MESNIEIWNIVYILEKLLNEPFDQIKGQGYIYKREDN